MSKNQALRALVIERLNAAAEEIFALVERTISEYEEELCRSKEENQRKQQLLDRVLGPQVLDHGAAADEGKGQVEHFTIIKSEPEEHSIQPQSAQFPYTGVHVKGDHEEQTSVPNEKAAEDWTEPWEPVSNGSPQHSNTEHNEEREGECQNVGPISVNSATPESTFHKICKITGFDDKIRMAELMSKVRRHRCPICGKTLKRDLWSHMLVHTGERPFSCSVCQKGFTRKSSLTLHMKLHLSEKPFRCTICQKEFTQKSNYTIHLERHAKPEIKHQQIQRKRYKRRIKNVAIIYGEQNLVLENKERLSEHNSAQDEHTSSTPQNRRKRKCREMYEAARSLCLPPQIRSLDDKTEECPICRKRFNDLWPHMRLHTGERPFRCSVCRKGFPRRSSLTLHKRLHMQEKPYKCLICEKGFTQNNNYKRHMAKHAKERNILQEGLMQEEQIRLSDVYVQQYFQMDNGQNCEPQACSSAQLIS